VALSGGPDEPSPVVHVAANFPVVLAFESVPRNPSAHPGLEVRPHAFLDSALVLTPSRTLADLRKVAFSVQLDSGEVPLTLLFDAGPRDTHVRFRRRSRVSGSAELTAALRVAAETLLRDEDTCRPIPGTSSPQKVSLGLAGRVVQVCATLDLTYVRLTLDGLAAACGASPTVHIQRDGESVEVLLQQPAPGECQAGAICWMLAARTPPGNGLGYSITLLAQDGGSPCWSEVVDLKPNTAAR